MLHLLSRFTADGQRANADACLVKARILPRIRARQRRVTTWEMLNGKLVTNHNIQAAGNSRRIYDVHDFDGDSDVLWRSDNGTALTWEMNGFGFVRTHNFGVVSNAWHIRGVGEFDLA
jgi:hypothetical protein